MPACPLCHAEVRDDFGLITCESCGASLFVEMDGRVVSSESPVVEPAHENEAASPEGYYPSSGDAEAVESLGYPDESASESMGEASADLSSEFSSDLPAADPVESAFDFEESPAAEMPSAPEEEPSPFADVIEFANSDSPQVQGGMLTYRLVIAGLDTAELRLALKEALTDKRFLWEVDELMRSIKDGVLSLENLSAVKTYILVNRLTQYPLEIEWQQQSIHQSE